MYLNVGFPLNQVRSSARSPKKKKGPQTKAVQKSKADTLLITTTLLKSITEDQVNLQVELNNEIPILVKQELNKIEVHI